MKGFGCHEFYRAGKREFLSSVHVRSPAGLFVLLLIWSVFNNIL